MCSGDSDSPAEVSAVCAAEASPKGESVFAMRCRCPLSMVSVAAFSSTQKIPFTRSSLATDAAKRTTFQSP